MMMPKNCSKDEQDFYAMKVALYLDEDESVTIEAIADESQMSIREVRAGLEGLMERDLITSTPEWKYRATR